MQNFKLGLFRLRVVEKLALINIRVTLSEAVESYLKSLEEEWKRGFDISLINPCVKSSLVCHVLEPLLNVG